jgi:hypothetical protein
MPNARIRAVNAATESESLAPRTIIDWSPTDNTGGVTFECARFYRTAGTADYFGAPEPDGAIRASLDDLLQRVITVQTPGGPVDVPAPLLMGAVKTLFDSLYNELRSAP